MFYIVYSLSTEMFLQFNPKGRTIINDYQRRSNAVHKVLQNEKEKGPVTYNIYYVEVDY